MCVCEGYERACVPHFTLLQPRWVLRTLTWLLMERICDRSFWMRTLRSAISLRLLWRLLPNSAEQAARSSSWRPGSGRQSGELTVSPQDPWPLLLPYLGFIPSSVSHHSQASISSPSRLLPPPCPSQDPSLGRPRLSPKGRAHTWTGVTGWNDRYEPLKGADHGLPLSPSPLWLGTSLGSHILCPCLQTHCCGLHCPHVSPFISPGLSAPRAAGGLSHLCCCPSCPGCIPSACLPAPNLAPGVRLSLLQAASCDGIILGLHFLHDAAQVDVAAAVHTHGHRHILQLGCQVLQLLMGHRHGGSGLVGGPRPSAIVLIVSLFPGGWRAGFSLSPWRDDQRTNVPLSCLCRSLHS